MADEKTVVIAGGRTIYQLTWSSASGERSCVETGGTGLILHLLEEALREPSGNRNDPPTVRLRVWQPSGVAREDGTLHCNVSCFRFAFSDEDKDTKVWRVAESRDVSIPSLAVGEQASALDHDAPDLLILDDPIQVPSCRALLKTRKDSTWTIVRLPNPPPPDDPLWGDLIDASAGGERLIVILSVDDLRRPETEIKVGESWERTARALVWVMSNVPYMHYFTHFITSVESVGAVSFSKSGVNWKRYLYYDPRAVEGTWGYRYPGNMVGTEQCLVAGLALHALTREDSGDVRAGVLSGLAAARQLHRSGFVASGADPMVPDRLSFALPELAIELRQNLRNDDPPPTEAQIISVNLPSAEWCEPHVLPEEWTVLQRRYPSDAAAERLAYKIVEQGSDQALWDVPVGKFDNLLTADHREIAALGSLRASMLNYLRSPIDRQPLCIAVFGAPGSGKSFAVKAIAKSLATQSSAVLDVIEYNLTRFEETAELSTAFQEIRQRQRDGSGQTVVPLVFWDEFDAMRNGRELAWLMHFLTPMYEDSFGKAIFAFAGGTNPTWEAFTVSVAKQPPATKALDFKLRLAGHLDIAGLNFPEGGLDNLTLIRRAILLRSHVERRAPWLKSGGSNTMKVDEGVARALLLTEYKSGARSLEFIIKMSTLSERTSFGRSDLPHDSVLEQHLDLTAFRRLVDRGPIAEIDDFLPTHRGWPLKPEMVERWREEMTRRSQISAT